MKPISPDEVVNLKCNQIPDFVIEAFNKCIAENYLSNRSEFEQNRVIKEILNLTPSDMYVDRDMIFKNKWLDVEDIYRDAGWTVRYDKPGYNESYEASFIFRK